MGRFIYILLCLVLAIDSQGQAAFHQHNYTAPTGGGTCPIAQANYYIDSVDNFVTVTQQTAICDFYTSIDSIGYSKFLAIKFFGWANGNANKEDMIAGNADAVYFGSPSFNSNGIPGNNSTIYIDLGVSMNLAPQNDAGLGVYVQTNTSVNSTPFVGAAAASAGISGFRRGTAATTNQWGIKQNSTSFNNTTGTTLTGFLYASRTSSTLTTLYRNGTSVTTNATTSSGVSTPNLYAHALNLNGTATTFGNGTISMVTVTTGLSSTEAAAFNKAIERLHDAFGIGVQP